MVRKLKRKVQTPYIFVVKLFVVGMAIHKKFFLKNFSQRNKVKRRPVYDDKKLDFIKVVLHFLSLAKYSNKTGFYL